MLKVIPAVLACPLNLVVQRAAAACVRLAVGSKHPQLLRDESVLRYMLLMLATYPGETGGDARHARDGVNTGADKALVAIDEAAPRRSTAATSVLPAAFHPALQARAAAASRAGRATPGAPAGSGGSGCGCCSVQ